jgi:hypothetical protein
LSSPDFAGLHLMVLALSDAAKSGHDLGDFSPTSAGPDKALYRTATCACGAQAQIRWAARDAAPTLALTGTAQPCARV